MHAGDERGCEFFVGDDGAERQTSGERFGDREDVRTRREFLVGEVAAGAAQAALNFIGDQRGVVLRRQRARALPEGFADGENSAFALNGFEDQRADGVVEFRFEIGNVVEAHEFNAGDQGRERLAVFCGMGDGKRAKGAAVKGIFQREDASFRAPAVVAFDWA